MAKLGNAFDSNKHEDMNNFDPIPRGKYFCKVTKSDIKKTKDKKGQYIEFEYSVIKGEFKGRKVWSRMNIVNANPVAVEIAQKELATLCRACKKGVIQDTQQLHGIPFVLSVGIQPAKGDYPPSNKVMGYEPVGGSGGKGSTGDSDPFEEEEKKKPAKTTRKKKPEPEEDLIEGEDEVEDDGLDDDGDDVPWGDEDGDDFGDDGFEDEIPED